MRCWSYTVQSIWHRNPSVCLVHPGHGASLGPLQHHVMFLCTSYMLDKQNAANSSANVSRALCADSSCWTRRCEP